MTYNELQKEQIQWGLESGVDVSLFSDPRFDAMQMEQIRLGLEVGYDAKLYANPDLSVEQMEEIIYGCLYNATHKNKINISEYNSPDFSVDEMRERRYVLENLSNVKAAFQGQDLSAVPTFKESAWKAFEFDKTDAKITKISNEDIEKQVNKKAYDFAVQLSKTDNLEEKKRLIKLINDIPKYENLLKDKKLRIEDHLTSKVFKDNLVQRFINDLNIYKSSKSISEKLLNEYNRMAEKAFGASESFKSFIKNSYPVVTVKEFGGSIGEKLSRLNNEIKSIKIPAITLNAFDIKTKDLTGFAGVGLASFDKLRERIDKCIEKAGSVKDKSFEKVGGLFNKFKDIIKDADLYRDKEAIMLMIKNPRLTKVMSNLKEINQETIDNLLKNSYDFKMSRNEMKLFIANTFEKFNLKEVGLDINAKYAAFKCPEHDDMLKDKLEYKMKKEQFRNEFTGGNKDTAKRNYELLLEHHDQNVEFWGYVDNVKENVAEMGHDMMDNVKDNLDNLVSIAEAGKSAYDAGRETFKQMRDTYRENKNDKNQER